MSEKKEKEDKPDKKSYQERLKATAKDDNPNVKARLLAQAILRAQQQKK